MRLDILRERLGDTKVLLRGAELRLYRYDAIAVGETPLAVVLPETTQDIVEVVRFANEAGVAVVARGAASGLSGGAVPVGKSLVVSFNRMTHLNIDPERRLARAGPGVVTSWVSERAKPFGLYYPPDPASLRTSTIGGNLAENAGGPSCFKKGVTGDYVRSLEFVDSAGSIHRLGREAHDLAGLLVGSEGTLGLITAVEVGLEALPLFTRTLMASFAEVGQAAEAVSQAIAEGAVPSKLEFMDQGCIRAVEAYLGMGLPVDAGAILLADTDGDDRETVEQELSWVAAACERNGGAVTVAKNVMESERLWRARRAVSPALGRIRSQRLNEDISVPRSSLPQVVREIENLGRQYQLPLVQFGHIGDGNLHPNIMYDPRRDDVGKAWELAHQVARLALRHGGVLSGEHGIGLMKKEFMLEALGREGLEALWAIKHALDPDGIFNPGKVLPQLGH